MRSKVRFGMRGGSTPRGQGAVAENLKCENIGFCWWCRALRLCLGCRVRGLRGPGGPGSGKSRYPSSATTALKRAAYNDSAVHIDPKPSTDLQSAPRFEGIDAERWGWRSRG